MDWWFKKEAEQMQELAFFGKFKPKPKQVRVIRDKVPLCRKGMQPNNPPKCKAKPVNKVDQLLRDIFGWFHNPPETSKAFESGRTFAYNLCHKKGYKVLGSGHYSIVVGKEGSDKVIKIGKNPTDRWIEYCKWAAETGFAGTFAPQVYSYKYVKGTVNPFTLSVVERMDKTIDKLDKLDDLRPYASMVEFAMSYENPMAQKLADIMQPGSATFLKAFHTKFATRNLDLHGENIMLRKDGTVCFTDPLAGRVEPIRTRLRASDFKTPGLLVAAQECSCDYDIYT